MKKLKEIMIILGLGMMVILTGCSPTVESSDKKAEEIGQKTETVESDTDMKISGDLSVDVENGLLYSTKDGKIADKDGNNLSEYDYITILDNEYLSDGESVLEGYMVEKDGKIVLWKAEEVDYSNKKSPLEELKEKASETGCTIEVITDENWDDENFPELATSMADDGNYFDEVVLGAWFDENGLPIAGGLPHKLSLAVGSGNGSGLLEHFYFINGENFSMDTLKRTSTNQRATYAMVVVNITKYEDEYGEIYFEGFDYISSTTVVVHGNFSGILNGDDLLVFAEYTGLASDDTPNFIGKYIENINSRQIQ